jgi:hypothetical protein
VLLSWPLKRWRSADAGVPYLLALLEDFSNGKLRTELDAMRNRRRRLCREVEISGGVDPRYPQGVGEDCFLEEGILSSLKVWQRCSCRVMLQNLYKPVDVQGIAYTLVSTLDRAHAIMAKAIKAAPTIQ